MTPMQRRRHNKALNEVALATHKRYLGRAKLLTGIQSGWIKSLLTVWGDTMRGEAAPRLPRSHECWRVIRGDRWSDKSLERFTAAIKQGEEGYRGQHALNRAHAILWPKPTTSIIDTAIRDDDADFVEECVLKAFDTTDPVYIVGVSFYTTRKKSPILPASWNGQLHGLRSRWQRIGLTGACRYFRRKLSYLQGKA
jgi:hypothetical protein